MIISFLFWISITITCLVFNYFAIPAGWLLGSLLVSIIWSLTYQNKQINKNIFPLGLALIGLNLGSMLNLSLVQSSFHKFGFSIIAGVIMIIIGGLILGFSLYKFSNIDLRTSIFSFIPGGASVVIGIAESQNIDLRIVAAFHSARLIIFVSIIPLFVGYNQSTSSKINIMNELISLDYSTIGLLLIVLISFLLYIRYPLPAGSLLFATIITITLNFFFNLDVPLIIAGVGQVFIGATIGLRFDYNAIKTLFSIKIVGLSLLTLFVCLSVGIGFLFSVVTHVDVWSSILGWIPAGAGEMSSTAILLRLDETAVITIQLIRLYSIYLSLPIIIKIFNMIEKGASHHD